MSMRASCILVRTYIDENICTVRYRSVHKSCVHFSKTKHRTKKFGSSYFFFFLIPIPIVKSVKACKLPHCTPIRCCLYVLYNCHTCFFNQSGSLLFLNCSNMTCSCREMRSQSLCVPKFWLSTTKNYL